jgi:hypothetical protein
MEGTMLIPVVAAVLGLLCLGVLIYALTSGPKADFRKLMTSSFGPEEREELRERLETDADGQVFDHISNEVRKRQKSK